jgi:acetyl esterase/lipase
MMKLRDTGHTLPAAAACLSPVRDLADRGEPPVAFNDPVLPRKVLSRYRTSYVAQAHGRNPLISPVFGDWRGLPPVLVHVGGDEVLRGDAVRLQEAGTAAGLDVRLEIHPCMWHVGQIHLELAQAVKSLGDIAQFLNACLPANVSESA